MIHVGHFDVSGGTIVGGTDLLRLPWRADGFLAWATLQPGDGYVSHANFAGYTGDTAMSVGFATRSPATQGCVVSLSDQQAFVLFNRSSRATFTDRFLALQRSPVASIPGDDIGIAAWNRCNVQLDITGGSDYRVHYIAFAGATLNIKGGSVDVADDGSDVVASGLGFDPSGDPSLLITLSSVGTDDTGNGLLIVGFATGAPGRLAYWGITYNNVGGNAESDAHVSQVGATDLDFVSWDSDGFTLSQSGASGVGFTFPLLYLVLSDTDGAFDVGSFAWPSGSGSVSNGFAPEGTIFTGVSTGEEDTDGEFSIGAADARGNTVAAEAGVANVDDQRRWTDMSSGADGPRVLLDVNGNGGYESGDVEATLTGSGFNYDAAFSSGFGQDVNYASMRLSALAADQICRRGQVIRYV